MSFTGYDPQMEKQYLPLLKQEQTKFEIQPQLVSAHPIEFEPWKFLDVHFQKWGSCAGQATASAMTLISLLLFGYRLYQFSGYFAYIMAQIINGIRGDTGSTITGNGISVTKNGALPKEFLPDNSVPQTYNPNIITQSMRDTAKQHLAISFSQITEVEQWETFIKGGFGGTVMGGDWGYWQPDNKAVCDQFNPGGGGHAMMVAGWKPNPHGTKEDVYGKLNSHGRRYGDNGWAFLTRRFMSQFLKHPNSVVIGISGIDISKPVNFEWGRVESHYLTSLFQNLASQGNGVVPNTIVNPAESQSGSQNG